MKRACAIAVLTCMAVGCQLQHAAAPMQRPGLGHVVIFWFKTPGDPDARRRVIEASDGFRSIPGVVSVDAGERVSTPRPNVDKTYDVAVMIWFKDRDALEAYQIHPKHKAMLAEVGPNVDHTIVYDFARAGLK